MNRTTSLIIATIAFLAAGCSTIRDLIRPGPSAPTYAGTLTDLRWSNGAYISWGGNQSMFPQRPGNLSGMICIIETNGNDVACEFIRPGYKRQHLNNAYGHDAHALTVTRPGDVVQVYICQLTPDGKHADRSVRTNPLPLTWKRR